MPDINSETAQFKLFAIDAFGNISTEDFSDGFFSIGSIDNEFEVNSESNSGSGASTDQDIVYSISTNDGTSWSDFDDISEHYYEADSGSPSMATSGDYLYLVYVDNGDLDQENDPNGNDASARDGDVFFTRSDDEGETWDSTTVLSSFEADGETDVDYTSTTLQYRPDVSASGTNVHVSWSDYNSYEGTYSIYYSNSDDRGITWSTPIKLDDSSSGGRYGVTIASNDDDVVAAWIDTWNYDIYTASSDDSGASWTSPQMIESADSSLSYMPEIIFNEGKFHLVWTSTATGESVQYTSSTNGVNWEDAIFINTDNYSFMMFSEYNEVYY